jgi:hypothetical protein
MAGYGMPQVDIARLITDDGIDPKTLRVPLPQGARPSAPKANSNVAQSLYQRCMASPRTSSKPLGDTAGGEH